MRSVFAIACLFVSQVVLADMYVQFPPGSNNRLDEANRDRANGNRCFDSQNNNRGGYNVGKIMYYAGEAVNIQWTNQHSSGKYQMGHTEVVIQYMCSNKIRDGTSTRTPPDAPTQCINFDCDNDVRYCRHESYQSYQLCKATYRNRGLFTANQNLGGSNRMAARNTRQNPAGTRRGYECPEERDYYPYHRPSPWVDIAYIGADANRCAEVQANSDNVKGKGYCKPADEYWRLVRYERGSRTELPITQQECENSTLTYTTPGNTTPRKRFNWVAVNSHNISAPECAYIPTSRANHHGLINNKNEMMSYEWFIQNPADPNSGLSPSAAAFFRAQQTNPNDPNAPEQNCILRTRYNITTADYQAWESGSSINAGLDYKNNTQGRRNPDADKDPANVAIWADYGLSQNDVWCNYDRNPNSNLQKQCRGYIFRNNPRVDPFDLPLDPADANSTRVQLQLAINTNQFGRTFQDRTHTFAIMARPSVGLQGNAIPQEVPILNVGVRGKRGNIVQVYPATEYFFSPDGANIGDTTMQENQFLHMVVPGSNTNPNNNDGQGKQGTDRSNFCPMTDDNYAGAYADPAGLRARCAGTDVACSGNAGNSYAKRLTNDPYAQMNWGGPMQNDYANVRTVFDASKSGLAADTWKQICMLRQFLQAHQDYGNMEELDDAGADWAIAPMKVGAALSANGVSGTTGEVRTNYLCTRNNNFSNRSQKGALVVSAQSALRSAMASEVGGVFSEATGFGGLVIIPPGMTIGPMPVAFSSNEKECSMRVDFDTTQLAPGGWLQLMIPCEPQAIHTANVMKANGAAWDTASTTPKKGYRNGKYMTVVKITAPGTYKVVYVLDGLATAAVVAGAALFLCAICAAVLLRGRS